MEKVICDVCGTDYPETAAQCPICGCARGDGIQTSAGNTTAAGQDRPAYTFTKGGRFSKSNVRKRLKVAQKQNVPVVKPTPEPDYDDYDEEEDDQEEPSANGGLIVLVVLLLLAIIAVSSYIAIVHFDLFGTDVPTKPVNTTGSTQMTKPDPTLNGVQVPCESVSVTDSEITLVAKDSVWTLGYAVNPIDTTDQVKFESSNIDVATVDAGGRVTAVGSGEATITITCGNYSAEVKVVCNLGGTVDPSDPVDPSVPADPVVKLELNRSDITMQKKGESWNLYSGDLSPLEITWSSDDDAIATISNGKVVAVAPGRTTVYGEYQGQKVSCIIRCNWKEETVPENPTDPSEPSDPSDPGDEPVETYFMKINNADPRWMTGTDACEAQDNVGKAFLLSIVDSQNQKVDVTWTMSKEGIVTVTGTTVRCVSAGTVTLTASYGEQTFTCVITVK
jgi:hypothetical protein